MAASNDDPFADVPTGRTFVMPTPGQRAAAQARAPAPVAGDVAHDFPAVAVGLNPLVSLANSVLALVPQLRATSHHANPTQLKEQIAHSIREFERRARAQNIAAERVMAARYVLCTLIDEAAASTPWGGSGAWARNSLLVAFHNESWGGEKVFQLMARLAENVSANRDLLELIYACLALGFQGRYRVIDGGQAQLEAVRDRLAQLLAADRGTPVRALSDHWQPSLRGRSVLASWLPLWVTAAIAAAVLLIAYFGFAASLGSRAAPVEAAILAIRAPSAGPAPPILPATRPRLRPLLADDIKAGLLDVRDEADRSVIVIRGDGLFAPGAAELDAERRGLMQRIGAALAQVPGRVEITGHTDDRPIRSLRFGSNFELSQARANSVRDIITANGVARERVRAIGRGETQPVASNDTPANRALNRRVEITLVVGT
ncbi:MAG TPA: DotU family type VI secretion system protein [Burkholderiaceae bacterium]|nr:DotU family type VI secretion system protein [Burkholderiaceae bacterium]